ncbi:MAG: ComEC/Rec2 family competence protein [Clostridia bacterium]|nr:ComEC/Rec2 family competence protein [Clostridia bacterium]
MKRPFVYCAIGALMASAFSIYFIEHSLIFLLVCIVFIAVSALCYYFTTRFLRALCVFTAMALVFLSSLLTYYVAVQPVAKLENETVNLTAVVLEPPSYYDDHITYRVDVLEVESADYRKFKADIIDYSGSAVAKPSDVIKTRVKFRETSKGANRVFYYSDKVFINGSVSTDIQVVGKRPNFLISAREYITTFYSDVLPDDISSVLSALTIGDKSNLEKHFSEQIRFSGVSHIMVVSGLHLAIICRFLLENLRKFGISKKVCAALTLVAIFCVVALCSFTVSALRAGFTYAVMLFGVIILRRSDAINSLGFAACVIFLINPFAVANISFQLSFAATLGIVLICPKSVEKINNFLPQNKLHYPLSKIGELLAVNFAATVATVPICVYHFGELSLVSPITNVLISYCVTCILVLALISVLISVIPYAKFIYMPLILVCGLLTRYINFVIEALGSLRFASVSVNENCAFIILIIYAVIYATYRYLKRSKIYAYSR